MVRFQADLYGTYCTGIWVSPIRIRNSNLRLPNIKIRLYVKEKKPFIFVGVGQYVQRKPLNHEKKQTWIAHYENHDGGMVRNDKKSIVIE
jgi:hypothetical protein